MPDEFTEITSRSWFGRIGSSVSGVLFGFILLPVSVILLYWNEGRSVTTARSLKEGADAVISVDPANILPANEGRLIHLSGDVRAGEIIRDPVFGLSAEALRLSRHVEMYQWQEKKSSSTHKTLGGGEETTTTYSYSKAWSDKWINSSGFKHPQDHQNPASMPFYAGTTLSAKATLGAYKIPQQFISKMDGGEPLVPAAENLAGVPAGWKEKARLNGEQIYFGTDPSAPAVGDVRVTFKALKPAAFSILAEQRGGTIAPYPTKAGNDIERVESGVVTAASMFQHAQNENRMLTWGLRLAGFVVMLIGFAKVLNPLRVVADFIPILGDLVGIGTGLFSSIMAFTGSAVVIAVAWLAVRPVLAWTLFGAAGAVLIYTTSRARRTRVNA